MTAPPDPAAVTGERNDHKNSAAVLHGGEPRLTPAQITAGFGAARTPAAVRLDGLRAELAGLLRRCGMSGISGGMTYLASGPRAFTVCAGPDGARYRITIEGGTP